MTIIYVKVIYCKDILSREPLFYSVNRIIP